MTTPSPIDLTTSRRLARTLFASQSFFSAAFIACLTLMSVIAKDLSGGESLAGLPQTILPLSQAAMAFPIGILLDRFGRRGGLAFGYSVGALGGLVGAMAILGESFAVFLLAAALLGVARAASEQARYAAAEVFPVANRATALGTIVFAGTVGAVFGPLVVSPTGNLAEGFGLEPRAGAWLFAVLTLGIAALISLVLLRPDPRDVGREIAKQDDAIRATLAQVAASAQPARSMRQIFRDSQVQLAVASMLIGQVVMVAIMVMTPLHMDHHNHGDGAISLVIMGHTLGMFGLSSLTGRLIDRFGRVNLILAGAVLLILAAVMAPLSAALPLLVPALFILGLGWNFCFISGSSLLADALTTDERARAQGLADAMIAMASAGGSFASGLIFAAGGFIAVNALGFALTLFLTGIVGRTAPKPAPQGV